MVETPAALERVKGAAETAVVNLTETVMCNGCIAEQHTQTHVCRNCYTVSPRFPSATPSVWLLCLSAVQQSMRKGKGPTESAPFRSYFNHRQ